MKWPFDATFCACGRRTSPSPFLSADLLAVWRCVLPTGNGTRDTAESSMLLRARNPPISSVASSHAQRGDACRSPVP